MHICAFTVSPKKGEIVPVKFHVRQSVPWPSLQSGMQVRWDTCPELFPQYGSPAKGLSSVFDAWLLRSDWEPGKFENNRTAYAGYVPYKETVATPGALTLRGRGLGEMSAEIRLDPKWPSYSFRVNGFDRPTEGESNWLRSTVAPPLEAYIKANLRSLYDEAMQIVDKGLAEKLADARKRLDELSQEAATAVQMLAAKRPRKGE